MHVVSPEFGENVDFIPALRDALDKAPILTPSEVRIVLMEKYETLFGIYNHDNPSAAGRPLALVALHPAEDNSKNSLLYESIENFAKKHVAKHFGISFSEYMELPSDVCFQILSVSSQLEEKESATTSSVLSELNTRMGKT